MRNKEGKQGKAKSNSLSLPANSPIFLFQELKEFRRKNKGTEQNQKYFFISTADSKSFIIKVHPITGLEMVCQKIRASSPVCTVYDDDSSKIYLGLFSGDIEILDEKLKIKNQKYKCQNNNYYRSIELIYKRSGKVFACNLENQIIMINPRKMEQIGRYTFKNHITSASFILNPLTFAITGCIAFKNRYPPLLFNCDSIEQIKHVQKEQMIKHRDDENQVPGQIILMAYEYTAEGENTIFCAMKSENQPMIFRFKVQYLEMKEESQKIYCLPVFCFKVSNIPRHLSSNLGKLVYCSAYGLLLEDFKPKYKRAKCKSIYWSFLITEKNENVQFLLYQGFSFQNADEVRRKDSPKILLKQLAIAKY